MIKYHNRKGFCNFDINQQTLVICDTDCKIYSIKQIKLLRTIQIQEVIIKVIIDEKSQTIIIATLEQKIMILDTITLQQQHLLTHQGLIQDIDLDQQKNKLLSCGNDGLLIIWSCQYKYWECQQTITGQQKFLRAKWNKASDLIVACHQYGNIILYKQAQYTNQFISVHQIALNYIANSIWILDNQCIILNSSCTLQQYNISHNQIQIIRKIELQETLQIQLFQDKYYQIFVHFLDQDKILYGNANEFYFLHLQDPCLNQTPIKNLSLIQRLFDKKVLIVSSQDKISLKIF